MMMRAFRPFGLVLLLLGSCSSEKSGTPADAGRCQSVEGTEGFLPCDVETVLRAKCQRCHDHEEVVSVCQDEGSCVVAPFPLLTFADTRRSLGERVVYERMGDVVASGDMPFQLRNLQPPVEPLTEGEKSTLLDWIEDCAPPAAAACPP